MSMITMRGYVPKDGPIYPGQPKVISRCGFRQSLTDTANSLDGATPDKLPPATSRQDGTVAPVEEEISQAEMGIDCNGHEAPA
jgi:hypothetical protein